jgi:hypothetical protein
MAKHNHGHGDLVTHMANLPQEDNHHDVVYIFKLKVITSKGINLKFP